MNNQTMHDSLMRIEHDSPVGELTIIASSEAVRAVLWPNERPGRVTIRDRVEAGTNPVVDQARRELDEYFSGERTRFEVPVDIVGTDFQRSVWRALTTITYGTTRSYGSLADTIGKPQAARAVGAATGLNPVSIIVPCHRLIGTNGSMTGFAGGLDAKRWLLQHEQQTVQTLTI